jgi:hypothetical protein
LKRAFLTLILLLASTSLFAAERYTEVWNPPESQTANKAKAKTRAITPPAGKKKRKSTTSVKQVADKAAVEPQNVVPRVKPASPKQTEPVIPRKIEPNGEVMRV